MWQPSGVGVKSFDRPAAARRTILVYRSELLPRSETFIREQILAYSRWRGVLIGRRLLSSLPLEGLDFRLLNPVKPQLTSRVWWRFSRCFGGVPHPAIMQLKREGASLLHAHFGVDAIQAWPIARALKVPMVVTLHGYDINVQREWWEAGHWGRWFSHYPERLLELAERSQVHFVAVSEAIRDRAIVFGIPREKLSVKYIGVDLKRFSCAGPPIARRERRVLFVGRLVEKKGCEYLLRALSAVKKSVPDVSLIVAGDGQMQRPLRELAQRLGISATFRGALAQAQVVSELSQARVLCLPSVTADNGDAEGFGLVLLEAQASGVPVVTSARGGSTEGMLEGVTGFSFPERDILTLSRQLECLLVDDNIATSMSRAGPQFVAGSFDLARCTQSLEKMYDQILETSRTSAGQPVHCPKPPIVQDQTG